MTRRDWLVLCKGGGGGLPVVGTRRLTWTKRLFEGCELGAFLGVTGLLGTVPETEGKVGIPTQTDVVSRVTI